MNWLASILRHWKIALSLALVFFLGAFAGGVVVAGVFSAGVLKLLRLDDWPERTLREYRRDLKLTAEQTEKARPLMQQTGGEMIQIRNETLSKAGAAMKRMDAQLKPVLTPEQAAKLDEINRRKDARFRKDFKLEQP